MHSWFLQKKIILFLSLFRKRVFIKLRVYKTNNSSRRWRLIFSKIHHNKNFCKWYVNLCVNWYHIFVFEISKRWPTIKKETAENGFKDIRLSNPLTEIYFHEIYQLYWYIFRKLSYELIILPLNLSRQRIII